MLERMSREMRYEFRNFFGLLAMFLFVSGYFNRAETPALVTSIVLGLMLSAVALAFHPKRQPN